VDDDEAVKFVPGNKINSLEEVEKWNKIAKVRFWVSTDGMPKPMLFRREAVWRMVKWSDGSMAKVAEMTDDIWDLFVCVGLNSVTNDKARVIPTILASTFKPPTSLSTLPNAYRLRLRTCWEDVMVNCKKTDWYKLKQNCAEWQHDPARWEKFVWLLPCNNGVHWYLVSYCPKSKTCTIIDSLDQPVEVYEDAKRMCAIFSAWMTGLGSVSSCSAESAYMRLSLTIKDVPKQQDGVSCGYITVMNALQLMGAKSSWAEALRGAEWAVNGWKRMKTVLWEWLFEHAEVSVHIPPPIDLTSIPPFDMELSIPLERRKLRSGKILSNKVLDLCTS
jgi:hypothetical protein